VVGLIHDGAQGWCVLAVSGLVGDVEAADDVHPVSGFISVTTREMA
jgi:hypothetical protein